MTSEPSPLLKFESSKPVPTSDRRRWKRFRDASVEVVAWPETEWAEQAEVADESFGGIGLILNDGRLSVGDALDMLYNRAPLRAIVRSVQRLGDGRFRIGCEWDGAGGAFAAPAVQLSDDLRGGVYLLSALYGQRDWMGLGRAVWKLRQRAADHRLPAVVQSADALLDALAQASVERAYEGLLEECVGAVAQADWRSAHAG
jgi:hypothetical protein